MVYTKHDIEELDEGALSVAPTSKLAPLSLPIPFIVKYTTRQTRSTHILASRQERTNAVVKRHRITPLMHPIQQLAHLCDTGSKILQTRDDGLVVTSLDGLETPHHGLDDVSAAGLHGDADEQEPGLGLGASEGDEGLEGGEVGEIAELVGGGEVPEVGGRVGEDRLEFQVGRDGEEGDGNLGREDFFRRFAAPDVGVRYEAEEDIGSLPLCLRDEAICGEDWHLGDGAADEALVDEGGKLGGDDLPWLVIRIGEVLYW